MTDYFVAGGIYTNPLGQEKFELAAPGPGEPPYLMVGGVMTYFQVLWENAHLYRLNPDYSLSLVAASPTALERGIKAPPRIEPPRSLRQKLQKLVKIAPPGTGSSGDSQAQTD